MDSMFSKMSRMGLKRRELLLAALATGFAVAARPISARTILTDEEGLRTGMVSIPVADGTIPAYHAMPATGTTFPVILVVQEIFGVHEYIRDVCRRLAQLGYLAIAPELFIRQGDVSQIESIPDIISQVVSQVPDQQVMSDLDATVEWAVSSGLGDRERLGITGFCWGGRIVWLYAAHNPNLAAGVAWYGRLTGESKELQPSYPLDRVESLEAPVLGLYAGMDDNIPLDAVEQMQQALAAANHPSEIIVYPDAPHGFHADYRPTYREEAATDGWQRLLTWFAQYGVSPQR